MFWSVRKKFSGLWNTYVIQKKTIRHKHKCLQIYCRFWFISILPNIKTHHPVLLLPTILSFFHSVFHISPNKKNPTTLFCCFQLFCIFFILYTYSAQQKNRQVFTFCCCGKKFPSFSSYKLFDVLVMGIQMAFIILWSTMRPFSDSYRLNAENLCLATFLMIFYQIIHGTLLSERRSQVRL